MSLVYLFAVIVQCIVVLAWGKLVMHYCNFGNIVDLQFLQTMRLRP